MICFSPETSYKKAGEVNPKPDGLLHALSLRLRLRTRRGRCGHLAGPSFSSSVAHAQSSGHDNHDHGDNDESGGEPFKPGAAEPRDCVAAASQYPLRDEGSSFALARKKIERGERSGNAKTKADTGCASDAVGGKLSHGKSGPGKTGLCVQSFRAGKICGCERIRPGQQGERSLLGKDFRRAVKPCRGITFYSENLTSLLGPAIGRRPPIPSRPRRIS
jgi:hypothetical protein